MDARYYNGPDDRDEIPTCDVADCGRKVGLGERYCPDHDIDDDPHAWRDEAYAAWCDAQDAQA